MHTDDTTRADISVIASDEEQSILHHLDFCKTQGGKVYLQRYLWEPLNTLPSIAARQQSLKQIINVLPQWPVGISNGTLLMIEKFLDSPIDNIPATSNPFNVLSYRLFSSADYALIRFTLKHIHDFVKGLHQLAQLFDGDYLAAPLALLINRIENLLQKKPLQELLAYHGDIEQISVSKALSYARFTRFEYKQSMMDLGELWYQADALYSMAFATKHFGFCFPEVTDASTPELWIRQLWHPLLPGPVAYDIELIQHQNFLFLTGANMAGKSTFIKAVGVAAYLAHAGMGVPAKQMRISFLDGLLTNIQVSDNIVKGESYFFNEVQRIHHTIRKINDGRKWLVLIDELFKGTNIQDAMKCSTAVIEGLVHLDNVLFILSTHLYEIGDGLRRFPNILFRYFETTTNDNQLVFNYQLKEGISNDRIGYLILQREGVVQLLEKMKGTESLQ